MVDKFPNVQMAKNCAIKKVEYPKGTIHAKADIPAKQLDLWLRFGLVFETDNPITDKVAKKVRADLEIKEEQADEAELRRLEGQIKREEAKEKKKEEAKKRVAEKKAELSRKKKAEEAELEVKADTAKADAGKDQSADAKEK